jgi:hypothetical protein
MIRQNQLIQQQMQLLSVVARRKKCLLQLAADPTLVLRMNEILLKSEVNTPFSKRESKPVIVNVLYRTAAENISDAQIQSQIDE